MAIGWDDVAMYVAMLVVVVEIIVMFLAWVAIGLRIMSSKGQD